MKKTLTFAFLILIVGASTAQTPTKLFDVRNGNGAVLSGVTYTDATLIPYKDAASKQAVIDAFCDRFGFVPGGPQTKQQFFNAQVTNYIRQVYREQKAASAAAAASKTAGDAADAELP